MATPHQVANTFLSIAHEVQVDGFTHMQLQKLCYMSNGFWLQNNDIPLIEENPQVWQYGPVYRSLYATLRESRNSKISDQIKAGINTAPINEDAELRVIRAVAERYARLSGPNLSDLTHQDRSPWHQVASAHGFRVPLNTEIPLDVIRTYYRENAQALAG